LPSSLVRRPLGRGYPSPSRQGVPVTCRSDGESRPFTVTHGQRNHVADLRYTSIPAGIER
jgi:hypothetical protein